MSEKMKATIEVKEKWNEAILQIQHKTGGVTYTPEHIFISEMFMTALSNKKPLSKNEIETIECVIRVKLFENDLL